MKLLITGFFASLVPLLVIDGVWLGTMAKRFYAPHLGELMAASPKILPAAIFYFLYALGLTIFVVLPSVQSGSASARVFGFGALLGLVAYSTYDLTNQATLKNWPLIVTMVDLTWGAILTGITATIATALTKYFS